MYVCTVASYVHIAVKEDCLLVRIVFLLVVALHDSFRGCGRFHSLIFVFESYYNNAGFETGVIWSVLL